MATQIWEDIAAEYEGRTFNGSYRTVRDTVTVKTPLGSKTAPLSGLNPSYLAKMLLCELARKGRA